MIKYIRHIDFGIILFQHFDDDRIYHKMVAKLFGIDKVISAGFVIKTENGTLKCFGASISLGLGSKKEDSELLNQMIASV